MGLAFAPRASLLLPTGASRHGLGSGGTGIQFNLPFSAELPARLVAHRMPHHLHSASRNHGTRPRPRATPWPKPDLARAPQAELMLESIWTSRMTSSAGTTVRTSASCCRRATRGDRFPVRTSDRPRHRIPVRHRQQSRRARGIRLPEPRASLCQRISVSVDRGSPTERVPNADNTPEVEEGAQSQGVSRRNFLRAGIGGASVLGAAALSIPRDASPAALLQRAQTLHTTHARVAHPSRWSSAKWPRQKVSTDSGAHRLRHRHGHDTSERSDAARVHVPGGEQDDRGGARGGFRRLDLQRANSRSHDSSPRGRSCTPDASQ